MCYTENKKRTCQGCPSVISYTKGIRHKCFQVLKDGGKFGECGKTEGPYDTREKLPMACFNCSWGAEMARRWHRKSTVKATVLSA